MTSHMTNITNYNFYLCGCSRTYSPHQECLFKNFSLPIGDKGAKALAEAMMPSQTVDPLYTTHYLKLLVGLAFFTYQRIN
jgi:hypothetical protein